MNSNDYRDFFSEIHPSDNLRHNIETMILEKQLTTGKPTRRTLRVGVVAAVLVMVFCISVSAAYIVKNWDNLFIRYFEPTESQQSQLTEAVQDINISVIKDDITYTITQIIGDSNSIMVAMEIILPEGVTMPTLQSVQCALAHVEEDALAQAVGDITQETDFGYEKYNSALHAAELATGTASGRQGWQILLNEYDEEMRVLSVLINFHYEEEVYDRDCTLVLHQLWDPKENNLLSEPVVMHFHTDFVSSALNYNVIESGEIIGSLKLTPMAAYIVFPSKLDDNGKVVYPESFVQDNRITLVMKDGTEIVFRRGTTTENDREKTGTYYVSEIIELDQIQEINCGTLEFQIVE